MIKVAPSILSADFADLKTEIKDITSAGADYIHIDVMDGHFVPNITFGPAVVKAIRPHTTLPFDVHLMIENPDQYIEEFVKAGADIITVHVEACRHLHRTLQLIKSHNIKCGVVLNPHTPVEMVKHVLSIADLVLVMSVNPGFGGQKFIGEVITKIEQLAHIRKELGYTYLIEVDGGVTSENAARVHNAGADVLVAGSAVFGKEDYKMAIEGIKYNDR